MSGHSVDEVAVIEGAVSKALGDAGVRDDSPIRQVLIRDGEVYGGFEVCVPDDNGKSVSLAQRLAQMRLDQRWRGEFPAEQPKPAAGSNRPVVAQKAPGGSQTYRPDPDVFDGIVNGQIRVT